LSALESKALALVFFCPKLKRRILYFDMFKKDNITGVILAGGRATRMGGQDKGLINVNDKPLIEYVIAAFRPQVSRLFISANRHLEQYAQLSGCPVLADTFGHYDGPLAGMATALAKAPTDYVLFVPCDSPLLSPQLAERLYTRLIETHAQVSVADDGQRIHSVFSLLNKNVLAQLLLFLENGERSVQHFFALLKSVRVDCSDIAFSFSNINTPEELDALAKQLPTKNITENY
jgi:molybdenum cofactor guanylyltransferase